MWQVLLAHQCAVCHHQRDMPASESANQLLHSRKRTVLLHCCDSCQAPFAVGANGNVCNVCNAWEPACSACDTAKPSTRETLSARITPRTQKSRRRRQPAAAARHGR